MRSALFVMVSILLVSTAPGQTPGTAPSFDVASVRMASGEAPAKDDYTAGYNAGVRLALAAQGLRIQGKRVRVTDNSLKDLVRMAYGVKEHQVLGPGWIAQEKYDVDATIPAEARREQVPEMLRGLLRQRFQMEVHRETREMPVYTLEAAKGGAKLTAVAPGTRGSTSAGPGRVIAPAATLGTFAELLTKAEDHPVVDMTGIAGLFHFDLRYSSGSEGSAGDPATPLATALAEQFGLRLERRRLPVEVVVVDRANKVPTEN